MYPNRSLQFCLFFLIMFVVLLPSCKKSGTSDTSNINVRLFGNPITLQPFFKTNGYEEDVFKRMSIPLIEYDSETLEMTPLAAKSRPQLIEMTEGKYKGMPVYAFEILKEANWDDDHDLTAEDYVFTVKTIINPALPNGFARYFAFVDSVAIDPANNKRFTVYCNENYIKAEAVVGSIDLYPLFNYDKQAILNKYSLSQLKNPALAKDTVAMKALQVAADEFSQPEYGLDPLKLKGTGPYVLDSWVPKQFIKLKKKANWWGDKYSAERRELRAYPETITFLPIGDDAAALASLQSGDIDIMPNVNIDDFTRLQNDPKAKEKFNFFAPNQSKYSLIVMNLKDDILKDKAVRQALRYAIDVKGIVDKYANGTLERISGPIHPAKSYHNYHLPVIDQDLKSADQLLTKAGWIDTDDDGIRDKMINGEKRKLSLTFSMKFGSTTSQNNGSHFKNDAAKVGIEIILDPTKKLIKNYRSKNYQLAFLAGRSAPGLDDMTGSYHSQYNYSGYGTPQTDKVIERISQTQDDKERHELYQEIQADIYEECPAIYMYLLSGYIIVSKKFDETPVSLKRPGYVPEFYR